MSLEAVLDQELLVPDLKSSVPTSSGEVWGLLDWRVSDAADPVVVVVLLTGELAVCEGVPQLDGSVCASRDDLSVVGGEGAGEDLFLVASEGSGGLAGSEIPKTEGLVPGGRQSEVVVVGQSNIGNEVRVTGEALERVAVLSINISFLTSFNVVAGELPDHKGPVAGTTDEEIGLLTFLWWVAGHNGADPAIVALEDTLEDEFKLVCLVVAS